MTRNSSRILAVVLMVAILGGGIVIGIALDRLWLRPSIKGENGSRRVRRQKRNQKRRLKRLITMFRRRLKLNREQTDRVRKILNQMFNDIRAKRRGIAPVIRAIRIKARGDIRTVLNPRQKRRYNKLVKRYDRRRTARRLKRRR